MRYLYLLFGFQPKTPASAWRGKRVPIQPKSELDRVCQMCPACQTSKLDPALQGKTASQAVDSEHASQFCEPPRHQQKPKTDS